MASTFQYWTGAAWVAETNRVSIKLLDVLWYPMFLEVLVADPTNTRSSGTIYSDFQRVRVLEDTTSMIIFYGKIEKRDPLWNDTYGQVLKITARDNLNELLKRTTNTNYSGHTRRSALISSIIGDHSYSGNIDRTDTNKFEASSSVEAAGQLDTNLEGSGKNVLRSIYEIAQEDPWSVADGFSWDYYLDTTFSGTTPAPDLHYFQRGSRPAGGATTYGLTVQYGATETSQRRSMLPDYSFPRDPKSLSTRIRIEYVNADGRNTNLIVILIHHGVVAGGPFVVGNTITWNAGVDSATIQYVGSTYLVISGWTQTSNLPGTTITSGGTTAVVNTLAASPPGVMRELLEQDVEIVIRGYEIESLNEAREKAAAILYLGGDTVTRGTFKIVRWPYITRTGTHTGANNAAILTAATGDFLNYEVHQGLIVENTTDGSSATISAVTATTITGALSGGTENDWDTGDAYRIRIPVRSGHVIRVINSNSSINEDMLVTALEYEEGPNIATTKIEVKETQRGRVPSVDPSPILDIQRGMETGQWQTVGAIGPAPIAFQVVNITNVFTAVDDNDITWGAGTATFADGSTLALNAGSAVLAALTYLYIERGNSTIQTTTAFSNAIGLNKALIAIAQNNADTAERARVISLNSGSPQLVAGTLIANTVSAISANMGYLTAGTIEIPNGAAARTPVAGFTGFIITGNRIGGFGAGVLQVELRSADGRLYAGAGSVILNNADGIIIDELGTGRISLKFQSVGVDFGDIRSLSAAPVSGMQIRSIEDITLYADSDSSGTARVKPRITDIQDLGSDSFRWNNLYIITTRTDNLRGRTGTNVSLVNTHNLIAATSGGSNLGASGNYFGSIYGATLFADTLNELTAGNDIQVTNLVDLIPATNSGSSLGRTNRAWNRVYVGSSGGGSDSYISGTGTRIELSPAGGIIVSIRNTVGDIGTQFFGYLSVNSNVLYGIRELTAAPLLADLQTGEIVLGNLGNTAVDGRFWIKPNATEIFEFTSTARIT